MLSTSLCKQPCLLLSVVHSKAFWWPLLNIGDNWIPLNVIKIMPNPPEGFDNDCDFLIKNPFMLRFIPRLQKLKLVSFYQNFKIHRRVPFNPKRDEIKIFSWIKHHIHVSLGVVRSPSNRRSQLVRIWLANQKANWKRVWEPFLVFPIYC